MSDERSHEHHRKSLRLKGYDYADEGSYFITFCTHAYESTLSRIRDGQSILTREGSIVEHELLRTPLLRPNVLLDAHVVMPNHVHMLLFILERSPVAPRTDGSSFASPSQTVGAIVRGIKGTSASRIQTLRGSRVPVWQRSFYDHVVRTEQDLQRIREYIVNNALKWELDGYFPHDGGVSGIDEAFWRRHPD